MKLKLDITPDLVAAMAAEVKAGEKGRHGRHARGRDRAQDRLARRRSPARGSAGGSQTRSGARPIRKVGESLNAAALVWSKAPVIVGAHDTGR
jgi:hypothetical protein